MTKLLTILAMFFALVVIHNQATAITPTTTTQSDIEGNWLDPDGRVKIRIARNGDIYQGKVIWLKPGEETKDVRNENKNLRSRDVVGIVILDGFRNSPGSKNYTGGTIYAVRRGETLKADLEVAGNKLKLTIRTGFKSKTVTFTGVS